MRVITYVCLLNVPIVNYQLLEVLIYWILSYLRITKILKFKKEVGIDYNYVHIRYAAKKGNVV